MNEMTVVEILRKAKGRIDHPSRWCRYWSISEDGKRLCGYTALRWAVGDEVGDEEESPAYQEALGYLAQETGVNPMWKPWERLTYFNDGHSHKEVMALYDRAMGRAQATP